MENTKTALPTYLESKIALDSLVSAFADSAPLEETLIKTATLGIEKSLHIRDYALGGIGLALSDPLDSLLFIDALQALGKLSPSLYALECAYAFEAGDMPRARIALLKGRKIEPAHPLCLLLERVISAGWPASAFVDMRNSLHEKVTALVLEMSSDLVDIK